MNQIKEYAVLTGFNQTELSQRVNEAISKNYQPFGNPTIVFGNVVLDKNSGSKNIMNEGVLFIQAVVKY